MTKSIPFVVSPSTSSGEPCRTMNGAPFDKLRTGFDRLRANGCNGHDFCNDQMVGSRRANRGSSNAVTGGGVPS